MATFHISFKKLRRSEGKSSVYLSAYQNREKTKDNRTGATWDYSKKEGFFGSAILSPAGTPAELVKDSGTLWNAVEAGEKRKDAELCRYVDIAIPKELDDGQKKQIVLDYCQENFVDYGMIADIAFHDLDSHNPHAHVMLTLRTVSPNGFGNKQREWNNRENIEAWRVNWEIIANDRLKKYGHKSRIDSRSLKDQKEEAERKAVFAKTPKEKAKWISKTIELDRTPMTRIHRHQWRKGQKLRAMEQKEKALLLKIANVTYLQQTKPPQPEETMKIEKKPLARSIIDNLKALYKKTQHIFKSKPNLNKKKKEEKEDPQNFVSSYVINEFGEHILKTELETKPKTGTGTGTGGNNGGGKMGSGSGMSPMNQPQPKIEEPEPEPMPEFEDQQPKRKKKFGM
ncbi:hypothetical protein AC799_23590 [Salmonella enterica subsp. enterica serovar Newport]|jgi:hypothetical protein|nr:hypothetical protein [Salmonella enterica]ECW6883001.1 hypothetical protein [Salmonella enterica subsp. enterica serovar Newport]ELH2251133.1 MobA/MobL family protein [Escherichia coli]NBK99407.1 hypothetical protein [Erysipelotrichia bacterium]HCA9798348.1 MobA/MobL family protein [Klebsiella variicola subsp. variicola]